MARADLGRLDLLGKGGTARVYLTPDFTVPEVGAVVYKEYKETIRAKAGPALGPGLRSLVRFHEQQAVPLRRLWDSRIVWPLRVVEDGGAVTGVLMRLIPRDYFQVVRPRFGDLQDRPREVDALFGDTGDMTRIGYSPTSLPTRLALVAHVSRTYAVMHRAGVVVGDVSARNIVFDPRSSPPSTLIVDCDSARVAGNRSAFGRQPHTPHWEPPEALAAVRELTRLKRSAADRGALLRAQNAATVQNKETDVYKFGLVVVRVLDHGRGRAVNRDPDRAATILRRRLGRDAEDVLRRSLAARPADRPTMRDWYQLFRPAAAGPGDGPAVEEGRRPVAAPAVRVNGDWTFVEGTGWVRRPGSRS
jgi:serine/threonine protein kinase